MKENCKKTNKTQIAFSGVFLKNIFVGFLKAGRVYNKTLITAYSWNRTSTLERYGFKPYASTNFAIQAKNYILYNFSKRCSFFKKTACC